MRKRTSSAYYCQSDQAHTCRQHGPLYHDRADRALMTQPNTPVQDLGMYPSMMLYYHVIKDHVPVLLSGKYQIRRQWREIDELREEHAERTFLVFTMNIVTHFGNYKLVILFKPRIKMALTLVGRRKQRRLRRYSVNGVWVNGSNWVTAQPSIPP